MGHVPIWKYRRNSIGQIAGDGLFDLEKSIAFDNLYMWRSAPLRRELINEAPAVLGNMEPDVESLMALSSAIENDQKKTTSKKPITFATVGTATEINDYLRLLGAVGTPYCINGHGATALRLSKSWRSLLEFIEFNRLQISIIQRNERRISLKSPKWLHWVRVDGDLWCDRGPRTV